jgi:hypothetical protein
VLCPLWVKTQIAHADRNRPLGNTLEEQGVLDPVVAMVGKTIYKEVKNGLAVDKVADAVFHAIQMDSFYILTDFEEIPRVQTRMEDILHQRSPTFSPTWTNNAQKNIV